MFFYLVLLIFLLAHYSSADISELVQSGNGFVYDAPLAFNLPLVPLDLANDEKTQKVFGDSPTATKSIIEKAVVPSMATAASPKPSTTLSSRGTISISSAVSKKSGYNYTAPLKPYLIA